MPSVGGSIEAISINGTEFSVAADNDAGRKLGGDENEVQPNGAGTARLIKTAVAWMLSGLQLSIDDSAGDQEFIEEQKRSNDYVPITVTMASGEVYAGTGTVVGESPVASQTQLMSVDLSGPGQLVKQ